MSPKEIRRLPAPIYGIDKVIRNRGKTPEERAWDQYLIPGTDILRNQLGTEKNSYGTTDRDQLRYTEELLSLTRADDMFQERPQERFDLEHMRSIHRRLFAGVYAWAGEPRNVDLVKQGHGYGPYQQIEARWQSHAAQLESMDNLRGITSKHEFVSKLAGAWGAINYAHAFREGNTRSQTVFFAQLCEQAGWKLDTSMLSPDHPQSVRDEFVTGRFEYQAAVNRGERPDASLLASALGKAVSPSPEKEKEILAQHRLAHPELYEQAHESQEVIETPERTYGD